ncbi:hypothetical protein VNO78_11078 [Psophocarpus tetragonolobus]|uniref:Uncharacterized protein n=1 Tax=Psophocarpus tetragonolobus TaxID=3891 RepID=A0AAN9SKT1_PSOTE
MNADGFVEQLPQEEVHEEKKNSRWCGLRRTALTISPNVVLVMSIAFIAFVSILHVMGKLYFVPREA